MQMVEAFEPVSGQKVPFIVVGRGPGNIAQCWVDPTPAKKVLPGVQRGHSTICALMPGAGNK